MSVSTGYLNHAVAAERIADRHLAAQRSRVAAQARTRPERETRVTPERFSRRWLGSGRNPKLA